MPIYTLPGTCRTDQLRPILGELYNGCPNPMRALPRETWRELFEHVGYTADGEPVIRPVDSLRLWRGAPADYRDSWSWTDDRELAQRFATLRARRWADSTVWTAVVEPWRLLAFMLGGYAIGDWAGSGREYVVNTEGLTITEDNSVNDASRSLR